MAKHPDESNEIIYELARRWVDDCLEEDGSLLSRGSTVWTVENLAEVYERVASNPDTGDDTYWTKLATQVEDASDAVKQLAAEINAIHLLSVWPGAMGGAAKRSRVGSLLALMDTPVELPEQWAEAFDRGIADPGTHAKRKRYTQFSCIAAAARSWKSEPSSSRAAMRSDPWQLKTWLDEATVDEARDQRQMLLHYFHPETFEPIVSVPDKQRIAKRWEDLAGNDPDVDFRLAEIRRALTPSEGERYSYYHAPLCYRWQKDDPWPDLCRWANAMAELPNFDEEERDYKVDAARNLAAARDAVVQGSPNWQSILRNAFQNNITNWQSDDTFLKWISAEPDEAREALLALWNPNASDHSRLRAFFDLVPKSALDSPGNRLATASYLLLAEGAEERPPYKPSAFKAAWRLAGWKEPALTPETAVYDHVLVLCDELVRDCPSIEDRLDAQSALWMLTKWDWSEGGKPATWPDAQWKEFLTYLGLPSSDEGSAGNVDTGPSAKGAGGSTNHIEAAAAKLHVDRSVLDGIVELLQDKRQVILYGPPGTGKTYLAKALAAAIAEGDPERHRLVQFHPAMSYEDFVEGLRPEETAAGHVAYRRRNGQLMEMVDAAREADGPCVMVIDEINRANLPKVLGELLFLLEYRDPEDAIPLLYRPDTRFQLPDNLWFIGTMNTADRSISLIDAALRRRFHFVPFFPTQDPMRDLLGRFLGDKGFDPGPATFLAAVNDELLQQHNIDEHVLIGPSHFMNEKHYVAGRLPEHILERIWTYNVFPLVEELFWGQRSLIDAWRWPEVRKRHGSLLGVVPTPATQDLEAADALTVAEAEPPDPAT